MIKISFLFSAVFFIFGCATETKYLVKKPFLYEAVKGNRKAYFFGSMHYGIEMGDMPKGFWTYVDNSDIVVTEIDTRVDEQKQEYALTTPYIKRSENGKRIKDAITPDEYKTLVEKLKEIRSKETIVDIENALDTFSLFGVRNILSNTSELAHVGSLEYGDWVRVRTKFMLDRQIRDYAVDAKKYVDHLDDRLSIEWTKCLVGTDDDNIKDIRLLLKNKILVQDFAEFENAFRDYRDGLARGERYLQLPVCLLEGRNKKWMEKISATINNYKSPFFVIGALHLTADKGSLIEMLKAQNYTVRRVEELDIRPIPYPAR